MSEKLLPPLSPRLQTIADMITPSLRVADAGCDHGYLPIWLYLTGKSPFCLAMDVRSGPLKAAAQNIGRFGAEDGVQTRLSDGLSELAPREADCVVLAGMGGSLIVRILAEGLRRPEDLRELIAEPQSDAHLVRRHLAGNGFRIADETMVTEREKYYPVIRAVPSAEPQYLTIAQERYGPCLLEKKNILLEEFLGKERLRLTEIFRSLSNASGQTAAARREAVRQELEWIHEAEQYF